MPKSKVASIFWTERALLDAISIKKYLSHHFSSSEVDIFITILQSFEIVVCAFPGLYPESTMKKGIRRAVLSKVLSAYYRIKKNRIEVLALLDNRCDIAQWL